MGLDSWLIGVLADHRARPQEHQAAAGPEWVSSDFVFTTWRGIWVDHANIHRAHQAALARADLPRHLRIHDWRHAMATAWRARGVTPKIVSERLGHASVAVTGWCTGMYWRTPRATPPSKWPKAGAASP